MSTRDLTFQFVSLDYFGDFFRHSKAVDAMDMDGGGGQHDVNTSDKSIVRFVVIP